jgi:hypothetical protein
VRRFPLREVDGCYLNLHSVNTPNVAVGPLKPDRFLVGPQENDSWAMRGQTEEGQYSG